MARTLPHSSLPSLPSPSIASSIYPLILCSSLPNQIPTNPEFSISSSAASFSSKLQFIPNHPTTATKSSILLFTGLERPYIDTQSVIISVSVLAAISLSLFLGLKVTFHKYMFDLVYLFCSVCGFCLICFVRKWVLFLILF